MNKRTYRITYCALLAAHLCVLSPLSVPLAGNVPISLATLGVMLAGCLLGPVDGMIAVAVYILIGVAGVPVFAGYRSGLSVLLGVTGGYLLGYLPLAGITGLFARKAEKSAGMPALFLLFVGMLLGTAVLYLVGTVWFLFLTKMTLASALAACVLPFLPGDLLKMVVVLVFSRSSVPLRQRLAARLS